MTNKNDIINHLRAECGISKCDATDIVNIFFDTIKNNHNTVLYGFGSFKQIQVKPRRIRNIKTNQITNTKPYTKLTFTQSKYKSKSATKS